MVGRAITKTFNQGTYRGTVNSYSCPFYKIVYEDGDAEEVRGRVVWCEVELVGVGWGWVVGWLVGVVRLVPALVLYVPPFRSLPL